MLYSSNTKISKLGHLYQNSSNFLFLLILLSQFGFSQHAVAQTLEECIDDLNSQWHDEIREKSRLNLIKNGYKDCANSLPLKPAMLNLIFLYSFDEEVSECKLVPSGDPIPNEKTGLLRQDFDILINWSYSKGDKPSHNYVHLSEEVIIDEIWECDPSGGGFVLNENSTISEKADLQGLGDNHFSKSIGNSHHEFRRGPSGNHLTKIESYESYSLGKGLGYGQDYEEVQTEKTESWSKYTDIYVIGGVSKNIRNGYIQTLKYGSGAEEEKSFTLKRWSDGPIDDDHPTFSKKIQRLASLGTKEKVTKKSRIYAKKFDGTPNMLVYTQTLDDVELEFDTFLWDKSLAHEYSVTEETEPPPGETAEVPPGKEPLKYFKLTVKQNPGSAKHVREGDVELEHSGFAGYDGIYKRYYKDFDFLSNTTGQFTTRNRRKLWI